MNNSECVVIFKKLEKTLKELSQLIGWNLDEKLLNECLISIQSIELLFAEKIDNSEISINKITEHMLNAFIHTDRTISRLNLLSKNDTIRSTSTPTIPLYKIFAKNNK